MIFEEIKQFLRWRKADQNERIDILLRLLFSDEYLGKADYAMRFNALQDIGKSVAIMDLLRSRMTRIYKHKMLNLATPRSDFEDGVITGRLIELSYLIREALDTSGIDKTEYIQRKERLDLRNEEFGGGRVQEKTALIKKPI